MESLARARLNHLKNRFRFIPFWRRARRSGGNALSIENLKIGSSLAGGIGAGNRAGETRSYADTFGQRRRTRESKSVSDGILFAGLTQHFGGASAQNSRLWKS